MMTHSVDIVIFTRNNWCNLDTRRSEGQLSIWIELQQNVFVQLFSSDATTTSSMTHGETVSDSIVISLQREGLICETAKLSRLDRSVD